ncbi:MAG: hypothetical protein H7145_15215 [Akkermansiaceae bacterium]|nr:hypothetical protein [Armatimonadota bacterium]
MELYPSDLGKNRYLALLRRRALTSMQNAGARNGVGYAATAAVTLTTDEIKPSKHPFTAFWTNDLRVRDSDTRSKAATVAQGGGNGVGMTLASIFSATHLTLPLAIWAAYANQPGVSVLLAGAWGVGVYGLWRFAPRKWLETMDKTALTAAEIESLLPTARGNLERQFISLALDVLRVNVPTSSARTEIQASLSALGEAVSALPGEPPTHGVTASVYKNTLLQVAHLRDVVATFDNGLNAAIGAAAVGVASSAIDRLDSEANALALAHRELEDELGMSLFATLNGGQQPAKETASLPTVPETLVPTPKIPVEPPVQMVGSGGSPASGNGSDAGGKWWQGRNS